MTRVIIETGDGHRATVECEKDDMKVEELFGLVRLALIAHGYTPESIGKYLRDAKTIAVLEKTE